MTDKEQRRTLLDTCDSIQSVLHLLPDGVEIIREYLSIGRYAEAKEMLPHLAQALSQLRETCETLERKIPDHP
jgi:hypothetical protein